MVDKLTVDEYLAETFRECAMVAHNTNEVDRLGGHLNSAQQPESRLDVNTVYES